MNIISKQPFEDGGYPPIQSWSALTPPTNYAIVPEDLDTSVFYEYNGFVFLTIEDDTVINMEPNIEAWEAWKETIPEPQEPAPSPEEQLRADVDYISVMTGIELSTAVNLDMDSTAYKMAEMYYPRLWPIERLEALNQAGKLTEEEFACLTE